MLADSAERWPSSSAVPSAARAQLDQQAPCKVAMVIFVQLRDLFLRKVTITGCVSPQIHLFKPQPQYLRM